MKKLDEAEFKKIAYNCRNATFLIEKQQISKITSREKTELKIHLAGCSICKTFMQQSAAINRMVKRLFDANYRELKLDDLFKNQLQERINTYYDK